MPLSARVSSKWWVTSFLVQCSFLRLDLKVALLGLVKSPAVHNFNESHEMPGADIWAFLDLDPFPVVRFCVCRSLIVWSQTTLAPYRFIRRVPGSSFRNPVVYRMYPQLPSVAIRRQRDQTHSLMRSLQGDGYVPHFSPSDALGALLPLVHFLQFR
ncbi:hypothetical protein F5I97DRAFT_1274661 [Phlebopus sp. FC_14]|nr:hypothetical protein F5I97DRAFT_1274661 [Phlebopus sp. FC_14]